MAQGDKFQLAVAYPIKNSRFSLQNRASHTLTSVYVGGTTLNTAGVIPDSGGVALSSLALVFKSNDRIVVGPSTDANDLNKSESALISSMNIVDFILKEPLVFDYGQFDNYSGIGSALAGGWYLSGGGLNSDSQADVVVGDFDNFAQEFFHKNSLFPLALIQNLDDLDFLFNDVLYRTGFTYKFTDVSSGDGIFQTSINGVIDFHQPTESFIKKTFSIETSVWQAGSSYQFKLLLPGLGNFSLKSIVDDVFLEHTFDDFTDVKGSNSSISRRTEIPSSNAGFGNGYYEFDDFHNKGSFRQTKRNVEQKISRPDGSEILFDVSGEGERIEKYSFGCQFNDVTQSFYNILIEFQRIQKNGKLINIHPNVNDLPDFMTGKFKIGQVEKNSWDLSLRSFNFEFVEK